MEDIDKEFLQANNVVIRVHILEVFNLIQLDSDSTPNPYICVRLGEQQKTVIFLIKKKHIHFICNF